MEIESLRLDFLTIIDIHITKAQNILEHIREGRKKKKKTRRTQVVVRDLGSALPKSRDAWVACDLRQRARPRSRDAWVARDLRQRARPR